MTDQTTAEQRCGEECAEGHVYAGRCELVPGQCRPDNLVATAPTARGAR